MQKMYQISDSKVQHRTICFPLCVGKRGNNPNLVLASQACNVMLVIIKVCPKRLGLSTTIFLAVELCFEIEVRQGLSGNRSSLASISLCYSPVYSEWSIQVVSLT